MLRYIGSPLWILVPALVGCPGGSEPREPSWDSTSRIQVEACLLDLDCNAGSHCSLGICVTECSTEGDCGAGETCGSRGRCAAAGGLERMPGPPTAPRGTLSLTPKVVQFAPGATTRTVQVAVTGLEPGSSFRYRAAAASDMVRFDATHRYRRVTADGSGNVVIPIDISLNAPRAASSGGVTQVRIVTEAGEATITVTAFGSDGICGRFVGQYDVQAPVAMASFPFAFEVWPAAGPAGSVLVYLYPEDNVLFTRPIAVPGTWDAANGRLGFEILSVVEPGFWNDGDPEAYRDTPTVRNDLDLTGQAIAPTANWLYFQPSSMGNPAGRWLGRRIQLSLQFSDDGTLVGNYAERISGLTAEPIPISGTVRVSRRMAAADLALARPEAPVLPEAPLAVDELPAYPGAVEPLDPVVECARAELGDLAECSALADGAFADELIACGDAAVAAGAPLQSVYVSADGGASFRAGYQACTGTAFDPGSSPTLELPDLGGGGCYSEPHVACALAAYARAVEISPYVEQQLETYRKLFEMQGLASAVYGFMAAEYAAQALFAVAADTEGTLDGEMGALNFAANAAHVGQSVLFKPAFVDWLHGVPSTIPGADTENESMAAVLQDAVRRRWGALAGALERYEDALSVAARANPAAAADLPALDPTASVIRSALLAAYVEGALLGNEYGRRFGTPGVEETLDAGGVRIGIHGLLDRYRSHVQTLTPLGFDAEYVPLVGERENGDTRTTFRIFWEAAEASTESTSELQLAFDAFVANANHWNQTSEDRQGALEEQLGEIDQEIVELCGSVAAPEHPALDEHGDYRVPTREELEAHRQAVEEYPERCLQESDSGSILLGFRDFLQAAIEYDIAGSRFDQIDALVAIEEQRIERVTGTRDRYLTYRLSDMTELTSIALREVDQAEKKAKDAMYTDLALGVVGIVAGGAGMYRAGGCGTTAAVQVARGFSAMGLGQGVTKVVKAAVGLGTAGSEYDQQRDNINDRAEVEQRMAMRAVEEANEIDAINSQATVQSLLVRTAELLLEMDLANARIESTRAELATRVVRLENLLQRRDDLIERRLSDPTAAHNDPTFRIVRDQAALRYGRAHTRALQDVFFALRSLEYETGWDTGLASDLYRANGPDEMREVVARLDDLYECFTMQVGSRATYRTEISLRRDIFGISAPWIDPVTNEAYSEGDQFRRLLLNQGTLDMQGTLERLVFSFPTDLSINDATGFSISSQTRCVEQIESVSMRIDGQELGVDSVEVFLNLSGTGLLRSCESRVGADPNDDDVRVYDLAASGNSTGTSIQSGVNDWSEANPQLESRPVANSKWEMTILLSDPQNRNLDLTGVDDIRIRLDARARALPPGGHDLSACR